MKDLDTRASAPDDARTRALLAYNILDTLPESAFDDLARLAAQVCGTPSAAITFIDGPRQFFKASVGAELNATPGIGFCFFTVAQGKMLVIPDTLADPRFQDNPAVTADPPVRFYAGVPICDPAGHALGAICVMDSHPRGLTADQGESLRALGRQTEALLEHRRETAAIRQSEARQRQSEVLLRGVTDSLPVLIAYVDAQERYRFNNRAYGEWVGIACEQVTGRTLREVLGADLYGELAGNVAAALSGETVTYKRDLTWPDGTTRSTSGTYAPQRGPGGEVEGFAVLVTDDTENRRIELERKVTAERHASLVAAQQEVAAAARDLDAVLDIVAHCAQDMTQADGAVIEMAEGEDMVYRAASGGAAKHIGLRLRRETSLSGRCVMEGRLLVCGDTETDPRVDREACRRIGVRSMVVVPLTFLGRTIGVLKVYSSSAHAFPAADLPLLEMIVSLAVAALSAVSEAEARTALSLSEQRLHALITSVPVVLFALDVAGVFIQSEGKGLEVLGLRPGELVGRSYQDVYAGETPQLEGVARGLQGEAGHWLSEAGGLFFETQCLPLLGPNNTPLGLIGVAFDVTERVRAERALRQSVARQRQFLRDVLASVTEGRLILCQSEAELPASLTSVSGPISLTLGYGLRELRQAAWEACRMAGLSEERGHDMITAVSEAGMNCVVHVGTGEAEIFMDAQRGTVQARIADHGPGISLENLPHATLKKGFTTAGTLGHGMKMMLQTADHVFLLTGPSGTTVVIEQERIAPLPVW